jgi:ERF superfamily
MTEPANNGTAALHAALAAAQGEFPPIPRDKKVTVKTREGNHYSFEYAELGTILGAVRPTLSKHGLALVQLLEDASVRTELRHKDGGIISASFPLPTVPARPQELGSLITYLRRYAVVAMLGIATEDDDDAGQAAEPEQKPKPKPKEPASPPEESSPAGDVVIPGGRHQGKTIAELYRENPGYISAIAKGADSVEMRLAAQMFLSEQEEAAEDPSLPF